MLNNADKPPIEELHQFLEFQLPRQWAPVYGDLPLGLRRRKQASPSLQFSFLGPKLYVNTTQVTFWVVHSKIGHTTHFKLLLGTEPRIPRCLTQKTSLLGEDTCLVNSRNSFLLANVRHNSIYSFDFLTAGRSIVFSFSWTMMFTKTAFKICIMNWSHWRIHINYEGMSNFNARVATVDTMPRVLFGFWMFLFSSVFVD